jgi:hypothetical protein
MLKKENWLGCHFAEDWSRSHGLFTQFAAVPTADVIKDGSTKTSFYKLTDKRWSFHNDVTRHCALFVSNRAPLPHSKHQIPSEANNRNAQLIKKKRLLWNLEDHDRVHSSPQPVQNSAWNCQLFTGIYFKYDIRQRFAASGQS